MSDEPILDGNAAQVRAVIQQTISAYHAQQSASTSKWVASAPAWISLIVSGFVGIFMLASLVGDVAIAKTDAQDAKTAIHKMEVRSATMERDIKYLVEAEKRRADR